MRGAPYTWLSAFLLVFPSSKMATTLPPVDCCRQQMDLSPWAKHKLMPSFGAPFLRELTLSSAKLAVADDSTAAITSEKMLRSWAKKSVLPKYPPEAARKRESGIVVTRTYIDKTGNVYKVDILQSPSEEISQSVKEAVFGWRFAPPASINTKLQGKLTFYFLRVKGRFRVYNPQDAPNLHDVAASQGRSFGANLAKGICPDASMLVTAVERQTRSKEEGYVL